METLSQIIASFDIFQVLVSAFPRIYNPIIHAFEGMFVMLYDLLRNIILVHPGLLAGMGFFLIGYVVYYLFLKMRRSALSSTVSSQSRFL